jgi:hypothetical protein
MSEDTKNDQGFNEEELQDIMNEIEDLEKEYVEDIDTSEAEVQGSHDDLQDTIDKEIEELNKIEISESEAKTETPIENVVTEPTVIEPSEEDNVVSIIKEDTNHSTTKGTFSGAPVEFSANGEMNLNMNFSVGNSTATLMVSKEGGLSIQMSGVNLEITDEGCSVELSGGVKFTVPLTVAETSNKKAS